MARESGKVSEPTTRNVELTQNALHAAIHEDHGPLVGAFMVSIASPFETRFIPLNVNEEIDRYGELSIVDDAKGLRFFLSGRMDLDSPVSVWELDPVRPPVLRATYLPLLDELSSLPRSGTNVPVAVSQVRTVDHRFILISLLADSLLRYDVASNSLQPVFLATGTHVRLARRQAAAFTTLNAYKAFILPLE